MQNKCRFRCRRLKAYGISGWRMTNPLTDERRKCLESAAEQIERGVPDLEAQVELSHQKEVELAAMESHQDGGMQFS